MKFLFDLFPVILFFVAFKLADIYVATGVAIVATLAQIAWVRLRGRRVESMLWASFAIVAVFGGATLLLQDETFIKWKPTVLYWLFSAVIGGGAFFFRKNMIRSILGEQVSMPDAIWARLNWSWAGFFLCMGFANLYFAFNYPTEVWVNFKLFGGMGLMFAFVIGQALLLARHLEESPPRTRGSDQ